MPVSFCGSCPALAESGADVNVKNTDRTGYQTPLHLACLFQNAQIVRLLLDAGADPCARNEGEWTALDYVRKFTLATNPMREEILDLFRQYAPRW
jgi:ankyrin repeat protein